MLDKKTRKKYLKKFGGLKSSPKFYTNQKSY